MFEKLQNRLNVVEKFNIFGAIALVLALVGIVSLILLPFGVRAFNFDIDFLGGTTMTYEMHKNLEKTDIDNITSIVKSVEGVTPSAVQKSEDTQVVIKTNALDTEKREAVFAALKAAYNLNDGTTKNENGEVIPSDILAIDNVDSVMGADLRNAAILSAVLAIICMLVYIAIRFDWRSGLAAIVALAHDVFIVMGAYVVFRIPVNMTFIAVVLTILGYSINATIIIFDRVRENKKLMKKTSFADIVNKSVWQTATRSLNTTITTLLAIVLIAVFGVTSIRNFVIPLIVGVIAGLYSSMFISGPVWVKLSKKAK